MKELLAQTIIHTKSTLVRRDMLNCFSLASKIHIAKGHPTDSCFRLLIEDPSHEVREAIAKNPWVSSELIESLKNDQDEKVKMAATETLRRIESIGHWVRSHA